MLIEKLITETEILAIFIMDKMGSIEQFWSLGPQRPIELAPTPFNQNDKTNQIEREQVVNV